MAKDPEKQVLEEMSDQEIISFIQQCYDEAADAKRYRLEMNKINTAASLGMQDWSVKQPGQSREFLPKTGVALEQLTSFFKRGMTRSGEDWFEFDTPLGPNTVMTAREMRLMLTGFLDDCLLEDNVRGNASTAITDGLKLAVLESLAIFKVHGQMRPGMSLDPKQGPKRIMEWSLRLDVIPFEAFYEDPSGKRLYRIHETERDLWEVQQAAVEGVYDKGEVELLVESCQLHSQDEKRAEYKKGQSESDPGSHRKKVVVREFWGSILREDGSIGIRNCLAAVANGRFLIRKPEHNPLWHGQDPFVVFPLLRVPLGTHHRAVFDDASRLNMALNELFNLFIDGGLASVWGVRQLRADFLSNPADVQDGIPQGTTLCVNTTLPPGEKVLETVTTGQVPTDAMAVFEALSREFAQAALSNELKMGQLPGRQVKATEIVELQQSQAVVLDSLVADAELGLGELLLKAWLTVLQNLSLVPMQKIVGLVGAQTADALGSVQEADKRYALVAQSSTLKVKGLSVLLSKVRDFQKLSALMQMVGTNPILLQAFFTRYDPAAVLSYMMKTLQLDPGDFERAKQEEPRPPEADMATLGMFQQMAGPASSTGAPGGGVGGPGTGGAPMPAEINQMVNPATGMSGNA